MSDDKRWQFELEEYIRQGEPEQTERSEAWQTAIGLQAVDGLKTSSYLLDTAKEADIVSARIAKLLGEKTFQFSPVEWLSIHRRLFEGVFEHAGQIRTYNITKKEWVLKDDTVIYAAGNSIRETLDYERL